MGETDTNIYIAHNMEVEYITLYQATRDVLSFVSLMKEIEFVIKLQHDNPKVLCSIFENQSQFTKKSRDNHNLSCSTNATL